MTALTITLTVNGDARSFPSPLSVSQLIDQLALTGKRVALERNGEIVPRGSFPATRLDEGDAVEIVVAVGGG